MTCECGQPISDFHEAFVRALCIWCYLALVNDDSA